MSKSNVIIIKPVPNSKKFKNREGNLTAMTEEFYQKDGNGENVLVDSKPYESERFEDTTQDKIIPYSFSKRRFLLIDPDDITGTKQLEANSKKLNSMVAQCKIKYPDNHPRRGQFIEEVNIFDIDDPFFTNPKVRITLRKGEGIINVDDNNMINQVVMLGLKASKEFQVGSAISNSMLSAQTRYIIVDKEIDRKEKAKVRQLDSKARDYFHKLTAEKQVKIAIALGLIKSPKTDPTIINELLWDYATDTVTKVFDGRMTKQEFFVNLLESGSTRVENSYLFHLAKDAGIIKYQNKLFTAFGIKLGETVDKSIEYLSLNTNEVLISRLQEAIDALPKQ